MVAPIDLLIPCRIDADALQARVDDLTALRADPVEALRAIARLFPDHAAAVIARRTLAHMPKEPA